MLYLNLLISIALYFTATRSAFVSHTYNLPTQISDTSNVVTLDILDDAVYDMRYQTDCADCKCFVEAPVLNPEKQTDTSFTNPVVLSHISAGRLFLLHRSEAAEYSYSVFQVSPPSTLTELAKEISVKEMARAPYVYFSGKDNILTSYNPGQMVTAKIDDQGKTSPLISYFTGSAEAYYDIAFDGIYLFLAYGNGLEIFFQSQWSSQPLTLTLDDLEVEQGFQTKKLAVDSENKILYIYHPDSDYSTIVAVTYSNYQEISLLGNYDLGVKQIKQVLVSSRKLYVLHQEGEKYHYVEFLRNTENLYDEPKMIKLWEIPGEVNSIQLNDDHIVIDTTDYLYVILDDLVFETETSQLLVDIIHKQGNGNYSIFQGTSIYILHTTDDLQLNLYSAPHETPSLKCGTYKQGDYAGTVSFKVDLYRDSCADAPTKSDNNTCLDHYTFDADFTGNTFIPFDTDLFTLAPNPISLSLKNEIPQEPDEPVVTPENPPDQPGTNETSPGGDGGNTGTGTGPEEPPKGPEETPEGPVETPETQANNTTPSGGDGGSTGTTTTPEEEPTEGTPEGPEETPETPTNTTSGGDGGSTTKPPEDTNEPIESNNTQSNGTTTGDSGDGVLIKKPDLIDPDAPYFDKINNVYMLGFVGVIVLTCFGCVVKCLYDFVTRSKRRLEEQWKHKELEEEEEGEEQETGSKQNVQKGTDEESGQKGTDEESYEQ